MAGSKTATWVGGTAVLGVILVAGGWFGLISPVVTATAETRAQAESVRISNEQLQTRIVHLGSQFKQLDQFKSELAALRAQVPTAAEEAAYLRELSTIADMTGVTLMAVTPSVPQVFSPVARVSPEAAPVAEEPSEAGASEESAPAPEAAPASAGDGTEVVAPAGMVHVPLTISVVGTYDAVLSFVNTLQTGTSRLFLLTGMQGSSQADSEAGGGRPATHVGDLEVQIAGMVYVLPDTSPAAAVDPALPAPALPGAVPGKNPMVPIG